MRIDSQNKVGKSLHHVTIACGLFLYLLTDYIPNSNALDLLNWLPLLIEVSTAYRHLLTNKTVKT